MNAWGETAIAVLGGGVLVKLYETYRAGRSDVRSALQARVSQLEARAEALHGEIVRLAASNAACEERCKALVAQLRQLPAPKAI
jgi:chaperonin cofactor prefoldin